MLKLKLRCFGYLIQRANSVEKTLMLGRWKARGEGGQQKMRRLDSIAKAMDMSFCKLQTIVKD